MVGALWAAGGVAVILLIWWFVHWARKVAKRTNEAWAAAAARLEAEFDPKAGPWHNRVRRIDAVLEGREVVVDHYVISTGKSAQVFTRLRSDSPHAGELRLRVFPKHALSGLSKALGFQDVKTGDAAFDEAFVVKANDEQLARAWLNPEVRQAITKAEKYGFGIKKGKLTVQRSGLEADADRLEAATRATAALASAGTKLVDRWAAFAETEHGSLASGAEGRVRIELAEQQVPLRVDTSSLGESGGTVTHVRGRVLDPDAERFELLTAAAAADEAALEQMSAGELELPERYQVASSEPEQTAWRINDEARQRIAELEPLAVASDGEEVTVTLPGMVVDEQRLREALELAAELAREHEKGPYR